MQNTGLVVALFLGKRRLLLLNLNLKLKRFKTTGNQLCAYAADEFTLYWGN